MRRINTQCELCCGIITKKNRSKEHLFPNAIGGRRKIPDFICRTCNNIYGLKWDNVLSEQLNAFSVFFGITRERGYPPPEKVETTNGEQLLFHSNGNFSPVNPSYKEIKTAQGTQIQITARTEREARKMLQGVQGKFPDIDPEELLKSAKKHSDYLQHMIRFQTKLGGEDSFRSIIKTIVTFSYDQGINSKYYASGKDYLCSKSKSPDFNYYYDSDLIIDRPKGVPLHCVSLSGDPLSGLLLAYIEYFGFYRIVLLLSTQYCDAELKRSYALNPVTGKEIKVDVALDFSVEELSSILKNKTISEKSIKNIIDDIIKNRLLEVYDFEKKKVIREAVLFAMENCGAKHGEVLTQAHVGQISKIISEKMVPFFLAIFNLKSA